MKQLNERYENDKERLKELILNIRRGNDSQNTSEHQIFNENIQTSLKNSIDDIMYCLTSLEKKGDLIMDLKRQDFDYQNAAEYKVKQDDNEKSIQRKLTGNNHDERFLCSNDILNSKYWSKFQELSSRMSNEKKSNPHLHLVYVDFTYSLYELDGMRVFSPLDNVTSPTRPKSPTKTKIDTSSRLSSVSANNQPINILLIGKSGVGKSTLINTFVNHLQFDKYKDTHPSTSPLHVLIPFSRSFKSGSEKRLIHIGVSGSDEYYDQSATQQCNSYNLNVDNKKIYIIDTPGFDKPHGQNNDHMNMQQIISCLTNLTHLNAICVVIESDDVQLDDYQTCLAKLLQFLGHDAGNNIVFCFTKALDKGLNYGGIDAAINSMLKKLRSHNISFNKQTTFLFDSTYLINSTLSHQSMLFLGLSHYHYFLLQLLGNW